MRRMGLAGLCAFALAVLPSHTSASDLNCCSWDCDETVLGSEGNLANPTIVTDRYSSGPRALRVTEYPHGGTPKAYLAYIDGLVDGEEVWAWFWGYCEDPTQTAYMEIGAHYVSGGIDNYVADAGGSGGGFVWDRWARHSYFVTFDSDGGARDGLVIEARLHSSPADCDTCSTDYWIDSVAAGVFSYPSDIVVYLPCYDWSATPTRAVSWGRIKQLY